jgi:pimeloyl-ACP methyl ester carboxylesterase
MHLIVTVHGIRTFGKWQERLEKLVLNYDSSLDASFSNYKYGYFSIFAFLIPPLRWLVVRRFRNELRALVFRQPWTRIDLVGHSFGTHIIAWALWGLKQDESAVFHTVILSGSVLRSNFQWSRLVGKRVKRVINDCGTRDTVLLLSQFLVLFTGMAGRTGFSGMTSDSLRNRFSAFGHSGYFEDGERRPDDGYMRDNWVPLLSFDLPARYFNELRDGGPFGGMLLWLSNNAEPVKLTIYIVPILAFAAWVWAQKAEAIHQRDNALVEQSRFLEDRANQYEDGGDPGTAMLLALEALPDSQIR